MIVGQTHNRPAIKHDVWLRKHKINTQILKEEVNAAGHNRPYSDTRSHRGEGRYRTDTRAPRPHYGLAYKARSRPRLSLKFYLIEGAKFALIALLTIGALQIL